MVFNSITQREKCYETTKSLWAMNLWVVIVAIGLGKSADRELFSFGPNDDLSFAKIKIDTWNKYFAVVAYAFFTQICQSYVNSNLIPWVTNVIQDHKTDAIHMSWKRVMAIRTYHLIFEWLTSISELMFLFTLQLQFYLILMIGDIAVKLWRTNSYIKGKCVGKNYNTVQDENNTQNIKKTNDIDIDSLIIDT